MIALASASRPVLVLDTMCLVHFARADRLDVLPEFVVDWECWTTSVVMAEIREGVAEHPQLSAALELDWIDIAQLDTLQEIKYFLKWAERVGAGERHVGEASVLAVAELRRGIALTDDAGARRVGQAHGIEVHGTIWLLANACQNGKLTEGAAGNLVEALRSVGARLPCTGSEFPQFVRFHGLL